MLLCTLFVCPASMASLYLSESLCVQETCVSVVPLKTPGTGYFVTVVCRELQAPELWSRGAVGANGAIGAAWSLQVLS